jgi:hypothetical protein
LLNLLFKVLWALAVIGRAHAQATQASKIFQAMTGLSDAMALRVAD